MKQGHLVSIECSSPATRVLVFLLVPSRRLCLHRSCSQILQDRKSYGILGWGDCTWITTSESQLEPSPGFSPIREVSPFAFVPSRCLVCKPTCRFAICWLQSPSHSKSMNLSNLEMTLPWLLFFVLFLLNRMPKRV